MLIFSVVLGLKVVMLEIDLLSNRENGILDITSGLEFPDEVDCECGVSLFVD